MVGCGGQATSNHYASIVRMEDVEITAICDMDEKKLRAAAEKFKIGKTYTSFHQMIETEEADGIFIIMPPHHLFDLVIAAIRKKLHVFIEKPPGITTTIAETFAREARIHGVIGMTGLNRRFMPMINYAKEWIESKGGVKQVTCTFFKGDNTTFYNGNTDPLVADGIHSVDALRHIVGYEHEIDQFYSIPARNGSETDNAWNVIMTFSNGVTGILHLNYNVGGRIHTFELHGQGVSAYLNPDDTATFLEGNGGYLNDKVIVKTTQELAGSTQRADYYGFFPQDRHFIDCI
ncbi:MAG: dehydrogenase, partial [Paenibacillus sp.]|nr:dehydrogenase [Paenibacillus sp.]